ncbi:MAG: metallophosphoesterase, partial [Myxococcota bacterium]
MRTSLSKTQIPFTPWAILFTMLFTSQAHAAPTSSSTQPEWHRTPRHTKASQKLSIPILKRIGQDWTHSLNSATSSIPVPYGQKPPKIVNNPKAYLEMRWSRVQGIFRGFISRLLQKRKETKHGRRTGQWPPTPTKAPKPVVVTSAFFARAPWTTLDPQGNVTVSWESYWPSPGAHVYYGVAVWGQTLPQPRYRMHQTIRSQRQISPSTQPPSTKHVSGQPPSTKRASSAHSSNKPSPTRSTQPFLDKALRALPAQQRQRVFSAQFPLNRLFRKKIDVNQHKLHHRGTLRFRVELIDQLTSSTHLYDGKISFRCIEPCKPPRKFVRVPTLEQGPFVDLPTPTGATLSWETDVPTAGLVVVIAPNGKRMLLPSKKPSAVKHQFKITGLQPHTTYSYYVFAADARKEFVFSHRGTLQTAPKDPNTGFTFAMMSDSRSDLDTGLANYSGVNAKVLHQHMLKAYNHGASFVVFPGDMIDGYITSPEEFRFQLQAWKRTVQPFAMHMPIFEGMGNHETLLDAWSNGFAADRKGKQNSQSLFASAFVNPQNGPTPQRKGAPSYRENVYSFSYANAHFVVLNSNFWHRSHFSHPHHPRKDQGFREGYLSKTQLQWLEKDLAKARKQNKKHIFIFTHEPAFPNGGHAKDTMFW